MQWGIGADVLDRDTDLWSGEDRKLIDQELRIQRRDPVVILWDENSGLRVDPWRRVIRQQSLFTIFNKNVACLNAISGHAILAGGDPGILGVVVLDRVLPNSLGSHTDRAVKLGRIGFEFGVENQSPIVGGIVKCPFGGDFVVQLANTVPLANYDIAFEINLIFLFGALQLVGAEVISPDDDSIRREIDDTEVDAVIQSDTFHKNVHSTGDSRDLFGGSRVG